MDASTGWGPHHSGGMEANEILDARMSRRKEQRFDAWHKYIDSKAMNAMKAMKAAMMGRPR